MLNWLLQQDWPHMKASIRAKPTNQNHGTSNLAASLESAVEIYDKHHDVSNSESESDDAAAVFMTRNSDTAADEIDIRP
jgi:hypothetical protein